MLDCLTILNIILTDAVYHFIGKLNEMEDSNKYYFVSNIWNATQAQDLSDNEVIIGCNFLIGGTKNDSISNGTMQIDVISYSEINAEKATGFLNRNLENFVPGRLAVTLNGEFINMSSLYINVVNNDNIICHNNNQFKQRFIELGYGYTLVRNKNPIKVMDKSYSGAYRIITEFIISYSDYSYDRLRPTFY